MFRFVESEDYGLTSSKIKKKQLTGEKREKPASRKCSSVHESRNNNNDIIHRDKSPGLLPCLKNGNEDNDDNYNSIVSEIPSAIYDYPRRIILGLCMNLRKKQMMGKERLNALHSETLKFRRKNDADADCNDDGGPSSSIKTTRSVSTTKFLNNDDDDGPREQEKQINNNNKLNSSSCTTTTCSNNDVKNYSKLGDTILKRPYTNMNSISLLNDDVENDKKKLSLSNSLEYSQTTTTATTMMTTTTPKNRKRSRGDCHGGNNRGGGGGGSVMKMCRFGKTMLVVLLYLLILLDSCAACGPGRGSGRRRAPRKLTPLVYKQHVPNVPENTLSASGLNEGKINRNNLTRFKALVPNYNTDIIFRDEEGTGADRLMSQRCKEKVNTLAISVMNQWPGVRLRVTDGWDESDMHSSSLHSEGRAVDITTSDKDRSKYGMLARLAVEAGFDWVFYESRAHIHCSVKSDSSQAGRTGGCFSSNVTVMTPTGKLRMTDLRPGDMILSMDEESGQPVYSEVLMFLDRNGTETREFYTLTTSSGRSLTLTPSHLLYKLSRTLGDNLTLNDAADVVGDVGGGNDNRLHGDNHIVQNDDDSQSLQNGVDLLSIAEVTFTRNIEAGDWLIIVSNDEEADLMATKTSSSSSSSIGKKRISMEKVVQMEAGMSTGVFAPLTKQGNMIVDGVLASCYAVISDQSLAHWAFLPVRFVVNVYEGVGHLWSQFSRFVTLRPPLERTIIQSTHNSPSQQNKIITQNRRSSSSSSSSSMYSRQAPDQGVHWYASFLYSATKYLIPSHLLYLEGETT